MATNSSHFNMHIPLHCDCVILQNKQTNRNKRTSRWSWESPIYSQWPRSTGNNMDLQLVSVVGTVLWDRPLTHGIWC